MSEGLKPCPFCGATNGFYIGKPWEGGNYRVSCTKCWCASGGYADEQSAITAWNTRAGEKA
ncbi:Lar family restriction alleviation protein [Acetobacter oryzifermentans]|uniref:Lar family restriction alleviation protein n=1 Tax=Acetobacter oryzifermentans TaxID=1633874 RepID=UPI0039BF543C